MVFISIGLINKNIIPIFVGCAFCFSSKLMIKYAKVDLFKHTIIPNVFASISKLFTIIPFIIFKLRSTKSYINVGLIKENTNIKYIYDDSNSQKKKIIKGKFFFILLASTLFFIQSILVTYTIEIKTNFSLWHILFASIFCYFIFKIKLYIHHYISLILIILTGIIIDLCLENLQNEIVNNWLLFLMKLAKEIVYSLQDVLCKYIMEKKFCSVYELTLYNGFIVTILLIIFSIINYYYLHIDDFDEYFGNFNISEFLAILGLMPIQLGLYLSVLFTNKNNSPCHIFIIYIFGQFGTYFDLSTKSIILIICFVFILFWTLVFNELIEINYCGLEKNTKRNIMIRADSEDIFIDKNETINDPEAKDENNKELEKDNITVYT